MCEFRTIDDVDDWLEPMNYQEFWIAIRPYCLVIPPREDCDAQIDLGQADQQTVLAGLKYLARIELTKRHKLHYRRITPWLRLVEDH